MKQGAAWVLASAVMLISYAAYATEECVGGDIKGKGEEGVRVLQCYECDSNNPEHWYCDDPFNSSHADLKTCVGPCVKWVQKPKDGNMTVKRTCSTKMDIRMPISHVCMMESRPGDGHLCFCNRDKCNHATSLHHIHSHFAAFLLSLLTFLLVSRQLVHVQPNTRLWPHSGLGLTSNRDLDAQGEHVGYLQRHRQNDIKDINTG